MAITASGLFGLTLEKMLLTTGPDLSAEDHRSTLQTDAGVPAYDTHDFFSDLAASDISGTGYVDDQGIAMVGTVLTIGAPAAGQIRFDITTDPAWPTSTLTNAMALLGADLVGTGAMGADDPLIFLSDFVTAVSTTAGTLTVQIHANGVFYIDYVA